MMRTFLYVSVLLFCTVSFSQTSVSGKIVDESNQPVPGANVVVSGTSDGAAADFDGNFSFTTDQNPPFSLVVSNLGYASATVRVTSNNQNLTIQLTENIAELDEIVISASRTPERIRESPVTIERMDLKAIRNSSSPSYYDALENLKGVDINTSSLTFKSVNTRGFAAFANDRFVQLVDGMDNSSPALNFPLGNLLGMSELDVSTVELLPGASSALYGANAFNGIMLMRSKNPFDHQGISAYVKMGMTSSENAGDNTYYDIGVRAAHAFNDKVAAKASFSVLRGTDWFATDYEDYDNPGATRLDPGYNGLNVYGDEVSTTLDFDGIAIGLGLLPPGSEVMGAQIISRTGYEERDLLNYNAQSIKIDLAVHLRPWADDFEIIFNSKIGRGNTIYQGANRYALQGFIMQQHKVELRNNNFFVRSYVTAETAGQSYDTRFGAINLNRRWKSDTDWFGDYAEAYIGEFLTILGGGGTPDPSAIHQNARAAADTGRLIPGTPEFTNTLNSVISDGNLLTGAKFIDKTKLYHSDINYNFSHLTGDVIDVQVGGSYRQYSLNSQGTIFTDTDGPINYDEYGIYTQVQKKFAEDKLKFTGSIRYDKAQNFDGNFSPRLSLVFSPDEQKRHNFRASYQTGFRNPTTQDQYIGLDVGNALLVGSAPDNLDRYTSRPIPNSPTAQALGFPETVQLTGRNGYENAYTVSSVVAFGASATAGEPDPGLLEIGEYELVKPERVIAYEVGYRGLIADRFSIDVSGYYNQYEDFISNSIVLAPHYGNADLSDINPIVMQPNAVLAIANGDYSAFQLYTNSAADIRSYGGSIGVNTKIEDFDFGINYTYATLDFDQASDPDFRTNFNTPEHKVKASFGNTDLFENFGFNINWRWMDTYFWQAGFGDGQLPARSVVDLQINYRIPKIKSILKAGAANLLGHEYISAPGAGVVGAQYFISWTIND